MLAVCKLFFHHSYIYWLPNVFVCVFFMWTFECSCWKLMNCILQVELQYCIRCKVSKHALGTERMSIIDSHLRRSKETHHRTSPQQGDNCRSTCVCVQCIRWTELPVKTLQTLKLMSGTAAAFRRPIIINNTTNTICETDGIHFTHNSNKKH